MSRTKTNPTAGTSYPTSGLRALSDIAWMARRQVSYPSNAEKATEFNEANWLLHKMARAARLPMGHPDQSANRVYPADGNVTETASFYADGADPDFQPTPERVKDIEALSAEAAVQWFVTVMHPLAHAYADGASTYAPSMLNDATRVLRASGFDLSATEALGKSVWVADGMGDSFTRLTSTEIAERDTARRNTP